MLLPASAGASGSARRLAAACVRNDGLRLAGAARREPSRSDSLDHVPDLVGVFALPGRIPLDRTRRLAEPDRDSREFQVADRGVIDRRHHVVVLDLGVLDGFRQRLDRCTPDVRLAQLFDPLVGRLLAEPLLEGAFQGVAFLVGRLRGGDFDLFDAVQNEDLDRAREIHFRLQPFLDAIYQPPTTDGPMRLKEALRIRGELDTAKPRRPAVSVPESEIEDIRAGMEASGLL
jgi:hypothetical protein